MVFLCILCLCLAAVFLWQEKEEHYGLAAALKGLASLCFVAVGVLASGGGHTARLIIIGLVLGCIADVLLNLRWLFKEKGQLVFLVGILVFLSGHIVYLAAVLPMTKNWIVPVIVGVVLTAVLMKWIHSCIDGKRCPAP